MWLGGGARPPPPPHPSSNLFLWSCLVARRAHPPLLHPKGTTPSPYRTTQMSRTSAARRLAASLLGRASGGASGATATA